MDELRQRLTTLRDPALPGFEALLGDSAVDLLDAVTRPTLRRRTVSAAPAQVTWHPGRSLTVRYRAGLMARGSRKPVADALVAYAGPDLPEGATIVENDGVRVAAWPVTADPALPGLAFALDPARVPAVLEDIGAPSGPIRTQLRAYRPLRRAVVEVWAGQMRFFLKVVPPAQIAGLQARHRLMGDLLPVPRSHGWSTELGLVVLEALPGQTLRDALGDRSFPLPDPQTIAAMLDIIPDPGDGARAGSPLTAARSHARLLKRVVPERTDDLAAIVDRLQDDGPPGDLVPVHGDLHEAQLLVTDGAVSGLLDLDTAAMGYRINDWANMLGHLSTWQQVAPDPERVGAFARGVLALAETQADPRELRRRIAAMVIGLATGPFRVQMADWPRETAARIDLASRWLESAERAAADERPLMSASSAPHAARPS